MVHHRIKSIVLKLTFVLLFICGCTAVANAQTESEAKAPVSKGAVTYIDGFFKRYKTNPDSAVDYLFATNKNFNSASQLMLLKTKLDSMQTAIGKYLGKELIVQKSPSASLVLYSYLVKHEKQPMRFTFMFYKPKNDWELYRFNYDDQMDLELLEAAKINNKRTP